MCIDPATAIAIGSAVAGHMAQSAQAKAEEKAARVAYANEQTQIQERYTQENEQINQEMSQRSREALAERGRLRAAYGEGGLGGNSLDRIMNQNEFNLGQDLATLENTKGNVRKQTMVDLKGAESTAQSRFNSIQKPTLLGTGLKIAGSLAGDSKLKKRFNW